MTILNPSGRATALFGFGRIGATYAEDPLTTRYYRYATHAQVLRDHPHYDWRGVVDPSEEARASASKKWNVPCVAPHVQELAVRDQIEVAIIATPPQDRLAIIEALPNLRGVIVEKPLGRSTAEAKSFAKRCAERNIQVQVNLWRRADTTFRGLAAGELDRRVGKIQAISGLYGNGLHNNGIHIIDFLRQLCGDIEIISPFSSPQPVPTSSVRGDVQFAFGLWFEKKIFAAIYPLDFAAYRELGLDVWGEQGRLSILQEGLRIDYSPLVPHRAVSGANEVATDKSEIIPSTVGKALWNMYENLAEAMAARTELFSPISSALVTERIVAELEAASTTGKLLPISVRAK